MKNTTLKTVDLDGLNKAQEVNEQINILKKEFKDLKDSLVGKKVMLNANDGNWVEASIEAFYYNSKSYGEQIKAQVNLEDPYYKNNSGKLFKNDIFGYITLDSILEWNEKYNRGEDAEVLFENIEIGDTCHVFDDGKFVEARIAGISKDENGRLKIRTSNSKKISRLFSFARKRKGECELDVVDYLRYQSMYREQNPIIQSKKVASAELQ